MKKAIQTILTGLALILPVCFLASCGDLTGPQGPQGKKGQDAAEAQDTTYAVAAALAAKTGGDEDPWLVAVSGVDISDPGAFRHLITGITAGIEEGDIDLDLSGCTGQTIAYIEGVNRADKRRIVAISFPETLTHIVDGTEGYGAFNDYTRLGRISAPGLIYIGDYAFYSYTGDEAEVYNESLTEVDFPKVLEVGAYAFLCSNLASIRLPKAVKIGAYAFQGTTSSFSLTAVDLPLVESIGERAFYAWRSIASINLPELRELGSYAFASAGAGALIANTVLTGLELPKAESIGEGAFLYYGGLTTVYLKEAREIGGSAFLGNTVLDTVTLPKAETIGEGAFRYCPALETVTLPCVTSIGAYAFACAQAPNPVGGASYPNTALIEVDLSTVTSIGNRAFEYCIALESLKLGPEVPSSPTTATTATNGIFLQTAYDTGSGGTITVSVPSAKSTDYNAAGWKDIAQGATVSGTINYGTTHKAVAISTY